MAKGILAFFLAVYVVALTLDPCADKEISCPGSHIESHGDDQDAGDQHKDLCSPFCTCNCCNISMEVATPLLLNAMPINQNTIESFYNPQLLSVFLPSIWDPPKS